MRSRELPIQAKKEMAKDIAEVILCLLQGRHRNAMTLINEIKSRAVHLPENIQHDVLIFAEQIEFQFAYDPWHTITKDITRAADRLLSDLGVSR
jgi:hypothetical protein